MHWTFILSQARFCGACWLAVLLFAAGARAQQPGGASTADLLPPKFIPKSPTLSAFPRFDGQQLVNLPTGASQLAVPLAEVSCGPLHLPVSLAYSYTGLKVGQPYDFVGLGWALQAGTSITVQVNGLVDDNVASDPLRRYNPDSLRVGVNKPQFLKRVALGDVDTGPDLYSFALPGGLNGRFVILDTTVVLFPKLPVRIRRLSGATYGAGFQVTTEDGARYQFLAVEVTTPNPNNFGQNSQHPSAWHLTRMISADNADTLGLYYTGYNERLPRHCTVTTGKYFTGSFEQNGSVSTANPGENCGSVADYPFHNVQMLVSRVKTQYLDSVVARGTRLIVARGLAFRGENVPVELRRVQLLATTGGRREVKQIFLYQSRFDGGTATDYRLRLDSLQESANGTILPAYRFRYQPGDFPARNSAAQDYWGYANGASRNGDATTTTTPTLLADPYLKTAGLTPADREPSFAFAQAGALVAVRYPTGGTTRWAYEPGRMGSAFEDIPLSYAYEDVSAGYDPATAQDLNGHRRLITSSAPLVFQVRQQADVDVVLHRQPYDSVNTTGGTNIYRDFSIWRRLPTGDTLVTNAPGPGAYKVLDGRAPERSYVFRLPPGTYVAQVYCERYEANTGLNLRIPYRDSAEAKLGLLGPGIRVLRTTTAAAGAPPRVRTYGYAVGGASSGVSLLPQSGKGFDAYASVNQSASGGQGITTGTLCHFINTSSDNRGLGNEFNKYDFYYNYVTEENGLGQGTSVSYFKR